VDNSKEIIRKRGLDVKLTLIAASIFLVFVGCASQQKSKLASDYRLRKQVVQLRRENRDLNDQLKALSEVKKKRAPDSQRIKESAFDDTLKSIMEIEGPRSEVSAEDHVFYDLALQAYKADQLEEVRRNLNLLRSVNPKSVFITEIQLYEAELLLRNGRNLEAVHIAQDVILSSKSALARIKGQLIKGVVYEKMNVNESAKESYLQVARKTDNSEIRLWALKALRRVRAPQREIAKRLPTKKVKQSERK